MKTPKKMTKVQECARCGKRAREMAWGDAEVSVCLKCLNTESQTIRDAQLEKQWESANPTMWSSYMPRRARVGDWAQILLEHGKDIVRLGLITQQDYDSFLKTGVFRGALPYSRRKKKVLKVKLGAKRSRRAWSIYR